MTGYGKLLSRAQKTIQSLRAEHKTASQKAAETIAAKNAEIENLSGIIAAMQPRLTDSADDRAAQSLEEVLAPETVTPPVAPSIARAVSKRAKRK